MNQNAALFLHGGPGMGTAVERNWWKDRFNVEWWEQPAIPAASQTPFNDLVAATEQKLLARAEVAGGPVPVIAHSFGCALALEMAHRHPQCIAALNLLGAFGDLPLCFLRLAERILSDLSEPSAMQAAIIAAKTTPSSETFWSLLGLIIAHPGFIDHYWAPGSAKPRDFYNQLATTEALMNPAVFQAVMDDYLSHTLPQGVAPYTGPVRVFIGRYDPLLVPEIDYAPWSARFPQATLQVVDTGHYVHLESAVGWWRTDGPRD